MTNDLRRMKDLTYKIKPEPKVEKVIRYGLWSSESMYWTMITNHPFSSNTHCIITTVKDGEPVSVELEKL